MFELLTLIAEDGTHKEVFGELLSIGTTEFYQAAATNYRPEFKFLLADYYDYEDEVYVLYDGDLYSVLRTYRIGQELELTLTRASAEEVELYG